MWLAYAMIFGLSIEIPYLMIRLKLKCWFQLEMHEMHKTADFHSNLLLVTEGYQGRPLKCAQNSWFPLKSVVVSDWRLSRKTFEMRAFHAFYPIQWNARILARKTLTGCDNSLVQHIDLHFCHLRQFYNSFYPDS